MANKNRTFAVAIEMSPSQLQYLADQVPGMDIGKTVQDIAQSAMTDLSEGGLLLPPGVTRQILAAVGQINDPQDLVRFIEAGNGQEDGCTVVKWRVDPSFVPYYQSVADSAGISLDDYLQNVMAFAQAQGWLGIGAQEAETMFLSRQDYYAMKDIIGKDFITGTDLATYIKSMAGEPQLVEPQHANKR